MVQGESVSTRSAELASCRCDGMKPLEFGPVGEARKLSQRKEAMILRSILVGGLVLTLTDVTAAVAATAFDGNWSVLIVTDRGQCDKAYRYGLAIRDGQVLYEGDASVNVNGRVNRNGAVRVRVSAGSQSADGTGRLSSDQGTGSWRGTGSSGTCSGTWSAERR